MSTRIHPTAMIEEGVTIGDGTSVWDHVHIRHSTSLGEECLVGGKTTIAYGVRIGNRVKAFAIGAWRQQFCFRTRAGWLECFARHGFEAEVRPMGQGTPFANLLFRLTLKSSASGSTHRHERLA